MDYDDDGILDFVSGSYDPGDVYLCRGLGDGEYAAVQVIEDESGLPLVHHPEELRTFQAMGNDASMDDPDAINARVASFGSWPAMFDWDGDGDLDMLIGSFGGHLYRRMNVGTRETPRFSKESHEVLLADGSRLEVHGHANPVVADWDADGRPDLLIGSDVGAVHFFRNIGEPGDPKWEAPETLVPPKADIKFLVQYLAPKAEPGPGVRAQICVTDYNRDGRLDLLVGDYSMHTHLADLDDDQRAEFDDLRAEQSEIERKVMVILEDTEERRELMEELQWIAEEKASYLAEDQEEGAEDKPHSYVWLYLRKPLP